MGVHRHDPRRAPVAIAVDDRVGDRLRQERAIVVQGRPRRIPPRQRTPCLGDVARPRRRAPRPQSIVRVARARPGPPQDAAISREQVRARPGDEVTLELRQISDRRAGGSSSGRSTPVAVDGRRSTGCVLGGIYTEVEKTLSELDLGNAEWAPSRPSEASSRPSAGRCFGGTHHPGRHPCEVSSSPAASRLT
jgi:hypothetical protein